MASTTVSTLDELLSMREVPFTISYTSPEGNIVTFEERARTGPSLLGYGTISIIVPSRSDKPQYSQKPEFTRQDMETLLALSRSNPDLTLDSLLNELQNQKTEEELKNCPFCYPAVEQKTPLEQSSGKRIYHEGLYTESGKQVISFPNISPFMPGHLVTVFADHETNLAKLSYKDIENYFKSGQQIAEIFKSKGAKGSVDYMNWGDEAAASVKHPHAQRGMIIEGMGSRYRQCEQASLFQSNGDKNLMERMMDIIRTKYNELRVFENDYIFVWVPYAPTWPDQTEVIFKNWGNILDFSSNDLKIAAESMLGVIHGLRIYRDVTAINLVLYQSNFDCEKNGFRMRAVINPRNKNNIGGLEIGQGVYVIPAIPEETAMALRKHYEKKAG